MKYDIYLISLKEDEAKRNKLFSQFPKHSVNFIYNEAVVGKALLAGEYYSNMIGSFKENKRLMSPGEVGCTLSHIAALERFLESGSEHALIIEDDVIGSDEDLEKINQYIPYMDGCSILMCGGQTGLLSRFFQVGKKDPRADDLFLVHPFSYQYIYRTCCYLVNKKSAKAILNHHRRVLTVADYWAEIFQGVEVDFYYSNILQHPLDFSSSTIESERLLAGHSDNIVEKLFSFKKVSRAAYSLLFSTLLILFGYKRLK